MADAAAAGAAAGVINDLCMHPFDTLRAKLQVARELPAHPLAAAREQVRAVMAAEGPRGFYRGASAVGLFAAPAYASYFATYKLVAARLDAAWSRGGQTTATPAAFYFLGGLAAELVANALYIPYDVVKQRLQCAAPGSAVGRLDALGLTRSICRAEGVAGLYPGVVATLATYGPFSGIYFATYEGLRQLARGRDGGGGGAGADQEADGGGGGAAVFACAVGAGAVAAAATQPVDAIKTRLQVAEGPAATVVGTAREIVRREGARALFRGTLARVLALAPGCGLTMVLFEAILERRLLRVRPVEGRGPT